MEYERFCGSCNPSEAIFVEPSEGLKGSMVPYHDAALARHGHRAFYVHGLSEYGKRSAHAHRDVERTIRDAAIAFFRKIRYLPPNLRFSFFPIKNAMGRATLASDPSAMHRIQINPRLIESYSLRSLERVVLHELSHHYRHAMEGYVLLDNPHDAEFCNVLGQVDPTVRAERKHCEKFRDDVDSEANSATVGAWIGDGATLWISPGKKEGSIQFALRSKRGDVLRSGPLNGPSIREIAVGSPNMIRSPLVHVHPALQERFDGMKTVPFGSLIVELRKIVPRSVQEAFDRALEESFSSTRARATSEARPSTARTASPPGPRRASLRGGAAKAPPRKKVANKRGARGKTKTKARSR